MVKIWVQLFGTMITLSTFTLGNGSVIIPLMQQKFVDQLGWLGEDEMMDMVAFARSAPGAVTVNVAMQAGFQIAGFPGAAAAVLGAVMPPLIILAAISASYDAFCTNPILLAVLPAMRAAVAAVVLHAVWGIVRYVLHTKKRSAVLLMGAAFLLALGTDLNTALILVISTVFGIWHSERTPI